MSITAEIIVGLYTFLIIAFTFLVLLLLSDIRKKIASIKFVNTENKATVDNKFHINCKKFFLTSREIEIIELTSTGKPYKIIADELGISDKTVKNHMRNICEKTNVSNKMELINKVYNQ